MIDETTGVSNIEQVVIYLRWVSERFEAHEDFIGLYQVKLRNSMADVMLRLNLAVSKVRGQCYDGASAMTGAKVWCCSMNVHREQCSLIAMVTHLNLACARQCKLIRDTTHEITKLIKKSPCRDAIFKQLKEEMASDTPRIRLLCPTRWTVKAETLKSNLDNFNVLLELWDMSLKIVKETEVKARIQGVAAQMKKFEFFFGVSLGLLILRHTDLSRTMQKRPRSHVFNTCYFEVTTQ